MEAPSSSFSSPSSSFSPSSSAFVIRRMVGAYRDKTAVYKKCREEARPRRSSAGLNVHKDFKDSNNMIELHSLTEGNEGEISVDIPTLPPQWMSHVDETNYAIDKIKIKAKELAKLHKEHLVPSFDDRVEQEQAIEILTAEITMLFQQCQKRILYLGKLKGLSEQEMQLKHNIQASLAAALQDLSSSFRKQQQNYLQKLEGRNGNRKLLAMGDEDGEPTVVKEVDVMYDSGFNERQQAVLESTEREVQERNREIRQIHQSIIGLAEIFKEMSILVVDQGTILDRIDYNLEMVKEDVQKATVELEKAEVYQKKTGQKLCMLLLCAAIIGAVLLLLVKVVLK